MQLIEMPDTKAYRHNLYTDKTCANTFVFIKNGEKHACY